MAAERKPEPQLVEAAKRTAGAVRALQSRLNREAPAVTEDSSDELGTQLEQYFAASTPAPPSPMNGPSLVETPAQRIAAEPPSPSLSSEIRESVIEGVVDRILRSWDDPKGGAAELRAEVLERLVERMLAELSGKR